MVTQGQLDGVVDNNVIDGTFVNNLDIENPEGEKDITTPTLDKDKIVKTKKAKDPNKVIAALRGEITKKQKQIDCLKSDCGSLYKAIDDKNKMIRYLINRNLWQRIINKKYK